MGSVAPYEKGKSEKVLTPKRVLPERLEKRKQV